MLLPSGSMAARGRSNPLNRVPRSFLHFCRFEGPARVMGAIRMWVWGGINIKCGGGKGYAGHGSEYRQVVLCAVLVFAVGNTCNGVGGVFIKGGCGVREVWNIGFFSFWLPGLLRSGNIFGGVTQGRKLHGGSERPYCRPSLTFFRGGGPKPLV